VHTRSKRDWSSDVCSSDLTLNAVLPTDVGPTTAMTVSFIILPLFSYFHSSCHTYNPCHIHMTRLNIFSSSYDEKWTIIGRPCGQDRKSVVVLSFSSN